MTAARVLLTRWTTKDRLAVLVVALAVAFLTATTLLVTNTTAAATDLAADRGATAVLTGTNPGNASAVELPMTRATLGTGDPVTVVGGPPNPLPLLHRYPQREFPRFPTTGLLTTADYPAGLTLDGQARTLTLPVDHATGSSILPDPWLHSNQSLPQALGGVDRYWLTSTDAVVPHRGVPDRGVLAFFVAVTTQLRTILLTVAAGGTVLVGVAVYSVARMTVRDRRATIAVYRATGGTGRHVATLLTGRAFLLTVVGTLAGYAGGVIVPNAAINLAVYLGHPVTLAAELSPAVLTTLAPMYALVLAGGTAAGYLAVRPIATNPPAQAPTTGTWPPTRFSPRLLDARAFVPTAATLATFIAFVVVLLAVAAVLAPLLGTGTATITEPGASHPLASTVPRGYATVLQADGIDASPELLAFAVRNGTPFLARGVDYPAYTSVTPTRLVAGHAPCNRSDAVIGVDLGHTLDLAVGDTITLGGSTAPAFTRVTIVGTYRAPGLQDDQLLLTLATARHLTDKPPGTVHLVRTDALPTTRRTPTVVEVTVPRTVVAGTHPTASVTILNPTGDRVTESVTVTADDDQRRRTVSIPAYAQRRVTVPIPVSTIGTHAVTVAGDPHTVVVQPPDALTIDTLPTRAPPESTPLITVATVGGDPVADATVHLANTTVTTGADGRARLPLPEPGEYTVRVTKGDRETTTTITVTDAADRSLQATITVTPADPSPLDVIEATVRVTNPWNHAITTALTVTGADVTRTTNRTLAPGESTRLSMDLGHLAPGTYRLTVHRGDATLTTRSIRVGGNRRLATALATAGLATPGSGLGHAAQALVGNVEVLVAILLALGAVMAIGSTSAALVQSVHAHRTTIGIYRATGLPPTRLRAILLADVLTVGLPATGAAVLLAHVGLWALHAAGVLTIMGVRLQAGLTPRTTVVAGLAAVIVLVVASQVTYEIIARHPPATQLTEARDA